MRDQEEELLQAEAQRQQHGGFRGRRSYWVEEDSQWGLLADLEAEELDENSILWCGSELPEEVYASSPKASAYTASSDSWTTQLPSGQELHWEWCDDDFYALDPADGCYWSWAETKDWMDVEECFAVSPNEASAVMEAYTNFTDKMRSFRESRQVNTARHLSRGYYPHSMFKGKGKGKPQKGKGKHKSMKPSFSSSHQPSTSNVSSALQSTAYGFQSGKGTGQQRPGNPEYKGCFICGSKDHDFRSCPRRQQQQKSQALTSTGTSLFSRSVFAVIGDEDCDVTTPLTCSTTLATPQPCVCFGEQNMEVSPMSSTPTSLLSMTCTCSSGIASTWFSQVLCKDNQTWTSHLTSPPACSGIPPSTALVITGVASYEAEAEGGDESTAWATLSAEYPGHAILDSGATDSIGSLEALQQLMDIRFAKFGHKDVHVYEQNKKFRFGNGQTQRAESFVEIPQFVGGKPVHLGIHTLDAPGVPLLISIQTLTKLEAVVDFGHDVMRLHGVDEESWIPLVRGRNGHLLLDLTKDWFHSGMDLKSDDQSGGAYKGAFAAEAADEVVSQHACSSLPLLHVHRPPPLHPEQLTSDVMSTLVFGHGEAEHEVEKEASQQVSSEEILTAEPISECELMTEEEYRRAKLESKTADESASAGVDSGSSMHRVLPALIAISSVSSANHVAAFDRGRHDSSSAVRGRHQHDSHYESQGQVAAEKAHQVQEGPYTVPGEVRLPAGGRTRHEGRPSPGLPMLRPTCCDGRREGQLVGPQQAWPMDSLQPVQTENSICAGIRCHRGTPSGWSLGTRLGHSGVHGEGQDRGRPPGEREAEQQGLQQPGSGGLTSPKAGKAGGRQEEETTAASTRGEVQGGSFHSAGHSSGLCHRGHQESCEKGIRKDSREGRGRVGNSQCVGLDSQHGELRSGLLVDAQKRVLQEAIEEQVEDVNHLYEELQADGSKVYLMELCCPPDSRLAQTFIQRKKDAIRVGLPAIDVSTKKGIQEVESMLEKWRPELLWISLPCGPYSPIQTLFNESTPEKKEKSMARKHQAKRLIHHGVRAARFQLSLGGDIAWEWPRDNGGWNLPRVRELWDELRSKDRLFVAKIDGCGYGLKSSRGNPIKKPWKVNTTLAPLAIGLERRCPGHEHHDECLGGKEARLSGFYPQAMCDVIYRVLMECRRGKVHSIFPVFGTEDFDDIQREIREPLDEKEKKQALRVLEKLHRKTGHPSNAALANTLRHRGAHPEVLELARNLICAECQELRAAPLDPSSSLFKSETLWETIVMDNAEITVDQTTVHIMLMIDEASRLLCPHFLFEHPADQSRNATGEEVVTGLQDSWIRHFGMPAKLRLDPEGAFRSNTLVQWCEERGIEVFPCAAEAHEQIGIAERAIQTVKATTRQILQSGETKVWDAIVQACQTHNEFEKVEGYSPFQWAFGRQPTLTGRFHDKGYDEPWLTSSAVPGSSMSMNLKLRVRAQQAFLKQQSFEAITRAANAKTRKALVFLPGDVVYSKRIKPPAQPQAQVRLAHKRWRWYGPARVLASETRTDALGHERKAANIVWIVSHDRLKRCAPNQLRHASAREQVIAESSEAATTSWTFHSLVQTLYKGQYEILDDHTFPEDSSERTSATERRSRSLARAPPTPRRASSIPARDSAMTPRRDMEMTLQELAETQKKKQKVTRPSPSPSTPMPSSMPSTPTPVVASDGVGGTDISLQEYLRNPAYDPPAQAVQPKSRSMGELFEQPLFKRQKQALGEADDSALFATSFFNSQHELRCEKLACTIDLDLPTKSSEWRRLRRSPEAFYVKKVKGAEVKWHALSDDQKVAFDKAKQTEVSQWLSAAAVKRVFGPVPKDRLVKMRWVLTYKESGAAKGRIVLIGYQDPDLASLTTAAPTMSRRTRQLALQFSSVKGWRTLKADVKAAFLQGTASEQQRNLFAIPVPELASALGCQPGEAVQVLKSCYGLVNAPSSWFPCIKETLASLSFVQSKTDPCLWFFQKQVNDSEAVTLGYICSHVDDFLISGDEQSEEWMNALQSFYDRFKWSPWECNTYTHCGIRIREETDFSFSLDHSSFLENLEQIDFKGRPDHELITEEERTQLRGVLGALQWRSHQSTPMLAAKLGQLQSDITKATVSTLRQANKLAREAFQDRFISARINQLEVNDPKDVTFVMWSDAALANRRDLSSTGGFVLAATNQSMLRGDLAPLSLISWRSAKLQRKARSSLAAEAQALSEADQELMYTRLQWSEFCGFPIDLKDTASSVSRIKGAVVIDAKALFDVLQKKDLNSAGGGLRDKFSFLEVLCLLESLEKHQTDVKWVHSEIQLADALTKPLPHGVLQKVLIEGKWRLTFDPNFVSSKRLRKQRNCTEGNMVISGNLLGACEFE